MGLLAERHFFKSYDLPKALIKLALFYIVRYASHDDCKEMHMNQQTGKSILSLN